MKWEVYSDKVVMLCFVLTMVYAYLNQDTWIIYDYKVKYFSILVAVVGLLLTYFKLQPKTEIFQPPNYPVQGQNYPPPQSVQPNYPTMTYPNPTQPNQNVTYQESTYPIQGQFVPSQQGDPQNMSVQENKNYVQSNSEWQRKIRAMKKRQG